jgi:hypothetical protein
MLLAAACLTATPSASRAQGRDACQLVSRTEIADLSGMQVNTMTTQNVGTTSACVYASKSPSASVQVRSYGPEESAKAMTLCEQGQPVSGIGDQACVMIHERVNTLVTVKGRTALIINLFNPQRPNPGEVMQRIAQKALSRL